jgi:hypothetical protein
MKKIFKTLILLLLVTFSLVGCTQKQFDGKWNFKDISDIEIAPNVSASDIEYYKEHYGVEDNAALEDAVLAAYKEEGLFAPSYINFSGKYTYTYDVAMDREATWVFFKTSENEGFLSFYTEIDSSEGNPDPEIFPSLVYNSETNSMYMTYKYADFMVTIEFVK